MKTSNNSTSKFQFNKVGITAIKALPSIASSSKTILETTEEDNMERMTNEPKKLKNAKLSWTDVIKRLIADDSNVFNEDLDVDPTIDCVHVEPDQVLCVRESLDYLMIIGYAGSLDFGIIGKVGRQLPVPFSLSTSKLLN